MRERSEGVDGPGTHVEVRMRLNEFHSAIFARSCVLSDRLPVLWWLSTGEGWDKLKRAQLPNTTAQMSSIWAKGCMLSVI